MCGTQALKSSNSRKRSREKRRVSFDVGFICDAVRLFKDSLCFRCRVCEERFPSLVLLEYHKEDEDHWSYDDADDACQHQMSINFQCQTHKRRHRRARCNFESQREIMNELDDEQETEFGASDEDREMLVTSAKG